MQPDRLCPFKRIQELSLTWRWESWDGEPHEEEKNNRTIRRSRTGGSAIRYPGDDATLEERREYGQYLISGRGMCVHSLSSQDCHSTDLALDNDLDSDDEELLNDLGFGPDSLGKSLS